MSEVMDKPVAEKRAVILNPQRMGLAEQLRQDWVVNAEQGTTVPDVLDPQYFAHMASQLQQLDHIEVRLETGEWVLELLVTGVGRNYAQVHLLHKYDLQPTDESVAPAAKHRVEYKGPQQKHIVLRVADGAILQSGFDKKVLALEWLANYEKVTA